MCEILVRDLYIFIQVEFWKYKKCKTFKNINVQQETFIPISTYSTCVYIRVNQA